MRSFRLAALAAVVAAPLQAGVGSTQNLIADLGNFDTGSEPASWQVVSPDYSDLQWDLEDAAGCSGSGSGEATHTQNTVDSATAQFRLCVDTGIVPNVEYRIGTSARFVDEAVGARVSMTVTFYDGAGCTGNQVGSEGSPLVTNAVSGWQRIDEEGIAAGLAASADLRIFFVKFEAADPLATVLIDRVVLATDDYVFADGFESGEVCRWSTIAP